MYKSEISSRFFCKPVINEPSVPFRTINFVAYLKASFVVLVIDNVSFNRQIQFKIVILAKICFPKNDSS